MFRGPSPKYFAAAGSKRLRRKDRLPVQHTSKNFMLCQTAYSYYSMLIIPRYHPLGQALKIREALRLTKKNLEKKIFFYFTTDSHNCHLCLFR